MSKETFREYMKNNYGIQVKLKCTKWSVVEIEEAWNHQQDKIDQKDKIINELEKENKELFILAENCKKYIFSRKRKLNQDDDDMCAYVSTRINQLKKRPEDNMVGIDFGNTYDKSLMKTDIETTKGNLI